MSQDHQEAAPADLRWYLAILRRHKISILVITVLALAATFAFTVQQTPIYTSSAKALVKAVGVTNYLYTPGDVAMETERGIAESEVTAQAVKDLLDSAQSVDQLRSGLSVSVEEDTNFLDFSYSDPDPAEAQRMADAFATAYLDNRGKDAVEQVASKKEPIETEIKGLDKEIVKINEEISRTKDVIALSALQTNLAAATGRVGFLKQQLLPFDQAQTDGGDVVVEAALASSPSSPSLPRNLVLALVVGLALGIGLALSRERLDDRLRGGRELDQIIGAPILATVPKVGHWKQKDATIVMAMEAPKGPVAEAYRTLRTNLQFLAKDDDFRVLTLTSPTAGEGKTTTAANLACTLAQTGSRVIVASCDLRKPRLHRFFGLTNDKGMTDVLRDGLPVAEAAQKVEGFDTLRVIAGGPVPSNPAELLGSRAMVHMLEDLRKFADFVILDAPPVLAVSDPLILAPLSDGVLIVADAQSTSKAAAQHTREQLEQVGANIAGCILNNFDPSQAHYYPYENRYYYGSYEYHEVDKPSGSNDAPAGEKVPAASAKDVWSS